MPASSAASANFKRSSNSVVSGRAPSSIWSNSPIFILPRLFGSPLSWGRASGSGVAFEQSDAAAHRSAIFVCLEAGGMDAEDAKLLVAVFGIPGHSDRAQDFAVVIADQPAAAFRENLLAARSDQVAHEDRALLGALVHQLRAAAERQSRIGFAVGHLEADHRGAVFLLERLHLAARLDHDHADGPQLERRAALDDGVNDALGLRESDEAHVLGLKAQGNSAALCFFTPCAIFHGPLPYFPVAYRVVSPCLHGPSAPHLRGHAGSASHSNRAPG